MRGEDTWRRQRGPHCEADHFPRQPLRVASGPADDSAVRVCEFSSEKEKARTRRNAVEPSYGVCDVRTARDSARFKIKTEQTSPSGGAAESARRGQEVR